MDTRWRPLVLHDDEQGNCRSSGKVLNLQTVVDQLGWRNLASGEITDNKRRPMRCDQHLAAFTRFR
jgi:hypothetical protein